MMRKYLFWLSLLTFSVANAQENLIPNGGFEDREISGGVWKRPINWSIGEMIYQRSTDKHTGTYAAQIYSQTSTDVGTLRTSKEGHAGGGAIAVESDARYKLTYWYKGTLSNPNVLVSAQWYNSATATSAFQTQRFDSDVIKTTSSWQKKEITLDVPSGATHLSIGFALYRDNGGYALIDDVSLEYMEIDPSLPAPVPSGLEIQQYQREIELKWNKSDRHTSWEVVVNGGTPIKVTTNSYIIEKLAPNTSYNIKIRAVKGTKYSEYTKESRITTLYGKAENDLTRVPHLRTLLGREINILDRYPQTIGLYYNDLYNPNAKCTYYIDGVQIMPSGSTLTFPKKGKQVLKVIVEEASDKIWELEYKVDIK